MTNAEIQTFGLANAGPIDQQVAKGLRKLAAHPVLREKFSQDDTIRQLFAAPVARYIIGKTIDDACQNFDALSEKGYRIGVEYVGEEITDEKQVEAVVTENLNFLKSASERPFAKTLQIGFDLSSVGLLISRELALKNTRKIAEFAAGQRCSILISMERSTHTDQIIDVFSELAPDNENLGLTVQAYLNRSRADLKKLTKLGRKIRLVKGVYDEHKSLALARGSELDERYVELASDLASGPAPFCIATHDEMLVRSLKDKGVLAKAQELEALHGCNPDLFRNMKSVGVPCRITGVYGDEWFLHFLHRLAEHTPNVLQALADYYKPDQVVFGERY
ncbi:MAG: proline dehydrogenase family protein [Roseobacter sp.]